MTQFMERAIKRVEGDQVQGDPLDPTTMIGAQASGDQLDKILSYIDIGRQEGAEVLTGGARSDLSGDLAGGFYVKPTVFEGPQQDADLPGGDLWTRWCRSRRSRATEEALARFANDTLYGLGAGVWSRDANRCYRFGRAIQAGRVWTNCYHAYPAHAAFGGYKSVGHRPREPPDDARSLSADQEHAGQLQPQEAGLFLADLFDDAASARPAPRPQIQRDIIMARAMKAAKVRATINTARLDDVSDVFTRMRGGGPRAFTPRPYQQLE